MNISILTFHQACNFGANLQAYSSCSYFRSQGHNVSLIHYTRSVDDNYKSRVPHVQYLAHKEFVERQLPITRSITEAAELNAIIEELQTELLVIGSDAVWRDPDDGGVFFAKWLFDKNPHQSIPVVSLSAAHMGSGFSPDNRRMLTDCLTRFKYITVRDRWTKFLVDNQILNGTGRKCILNPDPVFMLDDFVEAPFDESVVPSKGYFLMTLPVNWVSGRNAKKRMNWFDKLKTEVNARGLKLIELPLPEGASGMTFDYTVPYGINPLQWYNWIKNAKAFIGVRFHAIVSCISANVPFFSVDTYGSISRFKYVMQMAGLYKIARLGDAGSKIRNLLSDSAFSRYRIDFYIENISPRRIVDELMAFPLDSLFDFKSRNQMAFKATVEKMLK